MLKRAKILLNYSQKRNYYNLLRLRSRGFFQEVFPHEAVEKIQAELGKAEQTIYAGFDPTSDSLHVGNLLVLIGLIHAQRGQHQPIALIGGATGLIGDPSGRNTERKLLENEIIQNNLVGIKKQINNIFDNHRAYFWEKKSKKEQLKELMIVNNADWYENINFVDFISKVGRHFRLGQMLSRTSVQSRLQNEEGMSFTEFTYQIFQAYDWLQLFQKYNCRYQMGGMDQMGNFMTGCELITRVLKKQAYGLALPIITNEEGNKFGKSAGNAVWLDSNKTSEFSFYQFFLRQPDSEAEKLLKLFSFLPTNEVFDLIEKHKKNPELREAQTILADQLTLLIHGEDGLKKAQNVSNALYNGDINAIGEMKSSEVKEIFSGAPYKEFLLESGTTLMDLALKAECFKNKNDANRIITAGGFYINMKRSTNPQEIVVPNIHILNNGISLIRVGKRNYYIVRWL
ncbi:tyrosine--tRNA ligase, mitochondrial [Chironomus tepperi]|uniref:tyrosine--tRNA ligase, mitochondrial n=1 Tax=Chironomus tepperi TaxID=113505 RepID=UPI00391F9F7D